jgi:diguanylate cyclase (GGDEF)-like protein
VVSYNAATLYDRDRKLQGVFAAARDITERKQAEEQILHLASHDSLTLLPNRRLLTDRLEQAMATSKRNNRYGALLYLDLDKFKPINDIYGHQVGDLLLIELARRLRSCMRAVDTVARFGGDEFLVILAELDLDRETSITQAGIAAEKLRIAVATPFALNINQAGNTESIVEFRCSSSIGVVLFFNHEVGTEEIIRRADLAMYDAKEAGGNLICFSDS